MNNFVKIMKNSRNIALATSINNKPNVRVVDFFYDDKTHKVYFATFIKNNNKINEMDTNSNVAFTTIPQQQEICHVKVKDATALKSCIKPLDAVHMFSSINPHYEEMAKKAEDDIAIYEITFNNALVIIDFMNPPTVIEFN